jgi:hypothetical protein
MKFRVVHNVLKSKQELININIINIKIYNTLFWGHCVFFYGTALKISPSLNFSRRLYYKCLTQSVLPRSRNFGRKTQKGPKKIVWGRESLGPNFLQNYQKRAEKGPNFFLVWFCTKTVRVCVRSRCPACRGRWNDKQQFAQRWFAIFS